ncbi:MAG: hypothetical protein M1492_06935 [Gammaproteobacteria bacterium]|nr:hypothetical protein [Gammaproteobacteria bacterium]
MNQNVVAALDALLQNPELLEWAYARVQEAQEWLQVGDAESIRLALESAEGILWCLLPLPDEKAEWKANLHREAATRRAARIAFLRSRHPK